MAAVHYALVAMHLCSCRYFIDDVRDHTIGFYLLSNVRQRSYIVRLAVSDKFLL